MAVNNEATISETSWRMTRYMRGVSVPGFASFLGSVGVITSLNLILDAVNLLVLESGQAARSLFFFRRKNDTETETDETVIIAGLLLNIGMLVFSIKLWKKVSDNNMVEMRSLIKIGCYIMAGFELLGCVILFVSVGISIYYFQRFLFLGIDILILSVISLFACLLLVGMRMVISGLVNANIIFKITFFILCTIAAIVDIAYKKDEKEEVMYVVNMYLYIGWVIFYSSSFTVLHYNIMLYDQQGFEKFEMQE